MTNHPDEKLEKLRVAFKDADQRLKTAQQDLEFVKNLVEKISGINANLAALDDFYRSPDWSEGRDLLFRQFPNEYFASAGEDSIWDVLQAFYFENIKLLKFFANELYEQHHQEKE